MLGDQAVTLAAIDRIVHHATILEMNVDSYRRKEAVDNARQKLLNKPNRAAATGRFLRKPATGKKPQG